MHCGDSADPIVVARQIIQIGITSVSMISNVEATNKEKYKTATDFSFSSSSKPFSKLCHLDS